MAPKSLYFLSASILVLIIAYYLAFISSVDYNKEYPSDSFPVLIFRMVSYKLLTAAGRRALPTPLRVLDDMFGYFKIQVLFVTLDLNIPNILHAGPQNLTTLTTLTGVRSQEDLSRWLRAAESFGYYVFDSKTQLWRNTELSNLLRSGHPNTNENILRLFRQDYFGAFDSAPVALKTGEIAFELIHDGQPYFTFLKENPNHDKVFNAALSDYSRMNVPLREDYDWGKHCNRIIDIGGGNGQFLVDILSFYPQLSGIVLDQQHVVDSAVVRRRQSHPELASKLSFHAGSIFDMETYPNFEENDCITMKHILHDWSDESSAKILQNINKKMKHSNSKLIVIERVLKEHNDEFWNYAMDLIMQVALEGKERTQPEWVSLFSDAGFTLDKVVLTRTPFAVIVATSKNSI